MRWVAAGREGVPHTVGQPPVQLQLGDSLLSAIKSTLVAARVPVRPMLPTTHPLCALNEGMDVHVCTHSARWKGGERKLFNITRPKNTAVLVIGAFEYMLTVNCLILHGNPDIQT